MLMPLRFHYIYIYIVYINSIKHQSLINTVSFLMHMLFQLFLFPPFSAIYWEDNPQRNAIHQTDSEGEKKNKNLNKYFIRLFCDLMCFCLAEVYGNISGPLIKALTQWCPTLSQHYWAASAGGASSMPFFLCWITPAFLFSLSLSLLWVHVTLLHEGRLVNPNQTHRI